VGYKITEVVGAEHADEIHRFNALFPDTFFPLKPRHLKDGYWWLVHHDEHLVGFAGMVPFVPFYHAGYFKRGAILDGHRGKGLQRELMDLREVRARTSTDWTHLYSDCLTSNVASANNFIRAGFMLVEVERPWEQDALFWRKQL
jgi:RimJ/RimL family protein N-acetyltransferase